MIKKILLIFFSTIFALLLIEGGLRINGVNPWQYLTIKEQPTINKNDDTIHFHLRTTGAVYNDITLVYDITNDTFTTDTGKNYNFLVQD